MRRYGVSKGKSASQFRRNVSRTRKVNTSPVPQRGGFRL